MRSHTLNMAEKHLRKRRSWVYWTVVGWSWSSSVMQVWKRLMLGRCHGFPQWNIFLRCPGFVWSFWVPPEANPGTASRVGDSPGFFSLWNHGLSVPDPPWLSLPCFRELLSSSIPERGTLPGQGGKEYAPGSKQQKKSSSLIKVLIRGKGYRAKGPWLPSKGLSSFFVSGESRASTPRPWEAQPCTGIPGVFWTRPFKPQEYMPPIVLQHKWALQMAKWISCAKPYPGKADLLHLAMPVSSLKMGVWLPQKH